MIRLKPRVIFLFAALLLLLLVSVVLTISIGSVDLDAATVYGILQKQLTQGNAADSPLWTKGQYHIVWDIRVPRVLMGLLTGAGLAVCGAAMQAIVINPIADPYVLGVSSGASAGAAFALLTPIALFQGGQQVTVFAFIGAILASGLVYTMSRLGRGASIQPASLLLSGTAINAVMTAVTNLLIFLAKSPESIATVYYWQMGSIASAQWKTLPVPTVGVALGITVFCLSATRMNLMMMGDEDATAMGVNVNRFRRVTALFVAFVVASLVSVTGVIGFVGLMIPHLVRMLMGTSDNRVVLPGCALFGALFLVWADAGARSFFGAAELPLGIITAFTGAPFFIFLLVKQRMAGRGEPS